MDFPERIKKELDRIRDLLVSKNKQYGNSALDPIRVFSRANPVEQLKVRIDDKLSRIARGKGGRAESVEDTIDDLIGYLFLLRIAVDDYLSRRASDEAPLGSSQFNPESKL